MVGVWTRVGEVWTWCEQLMPALALFSGPCPQTRFSQKQILRLESAPIPVRRMPSPPLPVQAVSPPTQESVLMREACYRCIGEGFNHVSSVVDFGTW